MAAGKTYEPIATTTLSSDSANITFSSITSSYTDLRLIVIVRSDRASVVDSVNIQVNSDTGANYAATLLYGDGASAFSGSETNVNQILSGSIPGDTSASGTFGMLIVDFFNYAGSTNKTLLVNSASVNSATNGRAQRVVGLWRSTSAINAIKLYPIFGTVFRSGSTATLYGIKAA